MKAFPLPEGTRRAIGELSHEVMLRLLACQEQSDHVVAEVQAGKGEILAKGIVFNASGTAAQLPAVVDLRQRAESFLYAAKGALRDIGLLFDRFYGQRFEHKFHEARKWFAAAYGAQDPLLATLTADAAWIEKILNMRNAVDHPGTPSVLNLENFRLVALKPKPEVSEPTWRLDEEPRSPIATEMPVLADNLLTLFEDILTDSLMRLQPNGPFIIYEIPESERDPAMPIRLRVGLAKPIVPHEA